MWLQLMHFDSHVSQNIAKLQVYHGDISAGGRCGRSLSETAERHETEPLMPSRSTLQTMRRESGLACFQVDVPVKTTIVHPTTATS
jgi:hypothetical protein